MIIFRTTTLKVPINESVIYYNVYTVHNQDYVLITNPFCCVSVYCFAVFENCSFSLPLKLYSKRGRPDTIYKLILYYWAKTRILCFWMGIGKAPRLQRNENVWIKYMREVSHSYGPQCIVSFLHVDMWM